MKQLSILFAGLLILVTACGSATELNAPISTSTHPPTMSATTLVDEQEATSTPSPTATEIVLLPEQWFSEPFEDGMPDIWLASPGWENGKSSVLTSQPEQTFYVPVEWTDLVIHARFQRNLEGWSSIGFRNKGDNYYQFSFDQGNFILGRHSAEQYNGHILAGQKLAVSAGWHDLVIRVVGGHISITWDGQTMIQFTDQDPLASGDIFVQNWDNSLYELDLLEVSSPAETVAAAGGGLGNPTPGGSSISSSDEQQPVTTPVTPVPAPPGAPVTRPTGAPGNSITVDFSVDGGYFDARGNLWASLSNGGPSAFAGDIALSCTLWYQYMGIGSSTTYNVILEPGQDIDVQTPCTLDESQGRYTGANIVLADYLFDPNTKNNAMDLSP